MRDYELFLSPREEEILKALGKHNQYKNIAHQQFTTPNGILSQSAVRSHMTRIFQRYMEAYEVMIEYRDVFERRFDKHNSEIISKQRRMAKRKREAMTR